MTAQHKWVGFLLKEWLLLAALCGFLVTSIYARRLPSYSGRCQALAHSGARHSAGAVMREYRGRPWR